MCDFIEKFYGLRYINSKSTILFMKFFSILVIAILLFSSGCILPSKEHVCPNGTLVVDGCFCSDYDPEMPDVDPSDFVSITLEEESKKYYVQSNGQVNAFVQLFGDEEVRLIVGPKILYTGLDYGDAGKMPRLVSGNTYQVNISAPHFPGEYTAFVKRYDGNVNLEYRKYNISVIAEVSNETMAEDIANNFMYAHIPIDSSGIFAPSGQKSGWEIVDKQIDSQEDAWDVFLEAQYKRCPPLTLNPFPPLLGYPVTLIYNVTTEDNETITRNSTVRTSLISSCSGLITVTGHYIIDKKTGQIIG